MDELQWTIGQKLTDLRRQKGLSQEELGEKVGVSRQSISKWELDESLPNIDKLKELCTVFGVSADYFLFDTLPVDTNTTTPSATHPFVVQASVSHWGGKLLIVLVAAMGLAAMALSVLSGLYLFLPIGGRETAVVDFLTAIFLLMIFLTAVLVAIFVILLVHFRKNKK